MGIENSLLPWYHTSGCDFRTVPATTGPNAAQHPHYSDRTSHSPVHLLASCRRSHPIIFPTRTASDPRTCQCHPRSPNHACQTPTRYTGRDFMEEFSKTKCHSVMMMSYGSRRQAGWVGACVRDARSSGNQHPPWAGSNQSIPIVCKSDSITSLF